MRWSLRRRRPLDCRQVGRVLQRDLDGELDPTGKEAVRLHLEDCLRCGLAASVAG
jgi:anti-sigma factor RsiW